VAIGWVEQEWGYSKVEVNAEDDCGDGCEDEQQEECDDGGGSEVKGEGEGEGEAKAVTVMEECISISVSGGFCTSWFAISLSGRFDTGWIAISLSSVWISTIQ